MIGLAQFRVMEHMLKGQIDMSLVMLSLYHKVLAENKGKVALKVH